MPPFLRSAFRHACKVIGAISQKVAVAVLMKIILLMCLKPLFPYVFP